MIVKILGIGCSKCKALEQRIIALKEKHELDIQIEKVMSLGKVPKDEEILKWILEN